MKINYLGTGGGAGIPEMFCNCRICENARILRGCELRNRSMAFIDDELCIDLPCDARSSLIERGVDARKIRYLLVTHDHYDHFMAENLLSRPKEGRPIGLYISRGSGQGISEKCRELRNKPPIENVSPVCCPDICFAEPFVPFTCGKYTVVPLSANHDPKAETLNYIISAEGKNVLWLHDTGTMLGETAEYLRGTQIHFDFISMDCTLARGKHITNEHMDILRCAQTAEDMRRFGCVDDGTLIYLSHIGHLVECTHRELDEDARKFGFHAAYDGAVIHLE